MTTPPISPAKSEEPGQSDIDTTTDERESGSILPVIISSAVVVGLYKAFLWDPIEGIVWRIALLVALLTILGVGGFFIYKKSKDKDEFSQLFSKTQLLLWMSFTVSIAAVMALVSNSDDRALFLKVFAILFFSVLPALLYFQFLVRRGQSLWVEYVLNLFRLHADQYAALPEPPRYSVFYPLWKRARSQASTDKPAFFRNMFGLRQEVDFYRRKFEAVYGQSFSGGRPGFFRGENAVPVVILTILVSVGWVCVIQPETIWTIPWLPAFKVSGIPGLPATELRFGFLGAYFYLVQMLVRRYYQNDLKTGAYTNATVRVVMVILLTWTLGMVWPIGTDQRPHIAAAFVIGIFPQIAWQLITKWVKVVNPVQPLDLFHQAYPLSALDGLNLWYESRLVEEGIEDMQTLVTASLVDVMLQTRIPVDRLVDWSDQALLYLHLGGKDEKDAEARRITLREFGIRAASDVLHMYDEKAQKFDVPGMENLLNAGVGNGPNAMIAIVTALQREPALYHVCKWKAFQVEHLAPEGGFTPWSVGLYDRRHQLANKAGAPGGGAAGAVPST